MSASLVGSEMCIRDRVQAVHPPGVSRSARARALRGATVLSRCAAVCGACLLYTSDAADDM
eukprot:8306342-Alexandrium_andersonii.AAC.1